MKHWLNGIDREKPKYTNKILCPYYVIHHKYNADWPVNAGPSGRAVYGRSPAEIVGSNPTQGMDVCVVSVVCCQVEVSAADLSFVQRSPTECGASLYVIKKPRRRGG